MDTILVESLRWSSVCLYNSIKLGKILKICNAALVLIIAFDDQIALLSTVAVVLKF
jgi:hypothetical protein